MLSSTEPLLELHFPDLASQRESMSCYRMQWSKNHAVHIASNYWFELFKPIAVRRILLPMARTDIQGTKQLLRLIIPSRPQPLLVSKFPTEEAVQKLEVWYLRLL